MSTPGELINQRVGLDDGYRQGLVTRVDPNDPDYVEVKGSFGRVYSAHWTTVKVIPEVEVQGVKLELMGLPNGLQCLPDEVFSAKGWE